MMARPTTALRCSSPCSNAILFQLYRQANQGVSAALNHGLRYAKGVYLSTPDLDDIMLPSSVRIRAEYLDNHPAVGCVGALISYMDVTAMKSNVSRAITSRG